VSQDLIIKIYEVADELCDAHVHIERVPFWDTSRNRKHREHKTTQPGLIAQLYEAAVDPVKTVSEAGGSKSKPKSRPPLAMEAYSRYVEITAGALRWTRTLHLAPRDTVESNIRGIAGVTSRLDLDTLEDLHRELRTWRRWAAVMTGWQCQVFRPRVACTMCGTRGSLFVNAAERAAYCGECQYSWEGADLVDMAEHIRTAA
jgi:hypothetical protein